MISVNMHEAKTRLSELVRTVESTGQRVVICRDGEAVAELRPWARRRRVLRDLTPDPTLRPVPAAGYDPAEPLSDDEWPRELR